MDNETVNIRGLEVSLGQLRADVRWAIDAGYTGKFAFTPEIVATLLEYIANEAERRDVD